MDTTNDTNSETWMPSDTSFEIIAYPQLSLARYKRRIWGIHLGNGRPGLSMAPASAAN
jgi:hypothetical protein